MKEFPNGPPVGRLAPSPTGPLHLGNARTFCVAWLAARQTGGRVILRMEDLDQDRCRPEASDDVIADLRWLGLDWDEGPGVGGPHAPYHQSARRSTYRDWLARLIRADLVYPCTCSRQDIAAAATAPHVGSEGPPYPGLCAGRSAAEAKSLTVPFAWRFRTDAVRPTDGADRFDDQITGSESLDVPAVLGDYVVWRRDDLPAYQLAVVVDDILMGVTEIVRGDDLRTSTFRQLGLYRAFGAPPPRFAHLPLMVDATGQKLSKRDNAASLTALRKAGQNGQAIAAQLVSSVGGETWAKWFEHLVGGARGVGAATSSSDFWRTGREAIASPGPPGELPRGSLENTPTINPKAFGA